VRLLAPVADGLIVGSAIVRHLTDAAKDPAKAVANIEQLVGELMAAL
jgi:tryptophan synthase alpha subunit